MDAVSMLKPIRKRIIASIEGAEAVELLWIPPGFRNNILWNLGHIVVTQQLLHYGPARLPLHVDGELLRLYRNGTSPADWEGEPSMEVIRRLLLEHPERFEADYQHGRFSAYEGYTTKSGVVMNRIEDAVAFNHYHEGLHAGVIQTLRRLWRSRPIAAGQSS